MMNLIIIKHEGQKNISLFSLIVVGQIYIYILYSHVKKLLKLMQLGTILAYLLIHNYIYNLFCVKEGLFIFLN